MAVGLPLKTTYADGDVYSASDVNDTNGTVNLVGQTQNFYAGKNKIINGDFSVNQRSFTSTTTAAAYGFDRWNLQTDASAVTYSTQAFTPGAAPVTGYEAKNYARLVTTSQTGVAYAMLQQKIEDVRTCANSVITVSFWAQAGTGTPKIGVAIDQNFGSGGSSAVTTASVTIPTLTTSWVRYSFNVTVPSVSGKTIGTSSYLAVNIVCSMTGSYTPPYPAVGLQNNTFNIWGVQVEMGSTATAFQTATGTIPGELAACQRYYYQNATGIQDIMSGVATGTTQGRFYFCFPTQMRIAPLGLVIQNLTVSLNRTGGTATGGTWTLPFATFLTAEMLYTHGSAAWTAGDTLIFFGNNANSYYGWSAEL